MYKKIALVFLSSLVLTISACSNSDNNVEVDDNGVSTSDSSPSTYNDSSSNGSQSPYTESELKSDPTAPSTNVNDYNSDGEFVPENGPTDNPEDYNANGEYKPIEDMTKEEIEAELESMFNDNF
ncbi:MAG: hypothetical protein ABS938_00995 [Psychrobacillus psychrodurans]